MDEPLEIDWRCGAGADEEAGFLAEEREGELACQEEEAEVPAPPPDDGLEHEPQFAGEDEELSLWAGLSDRVAP